MKFPVSSGKHIKLRKVANCPNFCQLHNHFQLLNELWRKVGSLISFIDCNNVSLTSITSSCLVFYGWYYIAKIPYPSCFYFRKKILSSSNFGFISYTIDALFLRELVIFIGITIICSVLNNNTYFQSFKPQYFPDRLPHISLKRMCWD